jgi:pimeloyl-ACP methyl ester carboxylesterase
VAPRLAAVAAIAKFFLAAVAIGYVLIGLIRHAFSRFPMSARIAAAAIPLIIVALLAVNTVTVERETKAAKPGIGQVLKLPQGDVHVRQDGARGLPPIVLIHGFAASMRWWDDVVPGLAREHQAIRIDLLGHGGSEKSRDGYSMERQADVVAAVLRRLGVRRGAVVGHSMGGLVATALVERHRELVTRVMTIGVPPDLDHSGSSDPTENIGFVPVIGQLGWRVLPRSMVRNQLEEAFIPEYEVPDLFVEDPERLTYSSYKESGEESADYREAEPVDERLADENVPLTVVYGRRERVVDPEAADEFRDIPGARIVLLEGVGHSPQLERPGRTARLILDFASQRHFSALGIGRSAASARWEQSPP